MDTIFIIFIAAVLGMIALNALQPHDPPTIMYVPVEMPQNRRDGCMPMFVLVVIVFFVLLLMGK